MNELFYANYQSGRKVKRGAVSFKTSLQAGRGAGRQIKQNTRKKLNRGPREVNEDIN